MTLHPPALAPTPIPPTKGGQFHIGQGAYTLANGTTYCAIFLCNTGTGAATLAARIAGASRTLMLDPGDWYALGWDVAGTTWRVLRLFGVQAVAPDTPTTPAPPDTPIMVEDVNGAAACVPISAFAAYLNGTLAGLAGFQAAQVTIPMNSPLR